MQNDTRDLSYIRTRGKCNRVRRFTRARTPRPTPIPRTAWRGRRSGGPMTSLDEAAVAEARDEKMDWTRRGRRPSDTSLFSSPDRKGMRCRSNAAARISDGSEGRAASGGSVVAARVGSEKNRPAVRPENAYASTADRTGSARRITAEATTLAAPVRHRFAASEFRRYLPSPPSPPSRDPWKCACVTFDLENFAVNGRAKRVLGGYIGGAPKAVSGLRVWSLPATPSDRVIIIFRGLGCY